MGAKNRIKALVALGVACALCAGIIAVVLGSSAGPEANASQSKAPAESTASSPHGSLTSNNVRSREPTNSRGAVEKGLTARPDGKDISEGLPFKGMDVSLLDQTWLGAHDEEGEQIQGGLYDGGTSYRWLARNGTGDRVFSAIALDGVVAQVTKENLSKDYWANPGSVMPKELPDREAAGTAVVASGSSPIPEEAPDGAEDPLDYDDPEDYADANERAFELQGTKDAWQAAYEYWCRNAS